MFWMDISRDDDNEVNSVVVGCDVDGLRFASNDINDAKLWLHRHHKKSHKEHESKAIKQIGCSLKIWAGPKPYVPVPRGPQKPRESPVMDNLIGLLMAEGSLTTQEVSDLTGVKYNTTYVMLKRAHVKGLITKTKTKTNTKHDCSVRWSAA